MQRLQSQPIYAKKRAFDPSPFFLPHSKPKKDTVNPHHRHPVQKKTYQQLFFPRNHNQTMYRELLMRPKPDILVVTGPAGTSKTFGATMSGLESVCNGNMQKLVLARPTVPTEEEENLGFLPGKMSDKLMVWMLPVLDALRVYLSQQEVDYLLKSDKIEFCSLCHIRGRTFRDSFVIVDECQNMTPSQMLTMLTRIGENSKFVFTGDISQVDRKSSNSGLVDFVHRYQTFQSQKESILYRDRDMDGDSNREDRVYYLDSSDSDLSYIQLFQFDVDDIVRHPAIQHILNIYA